MKESIENILKAYYAAAVARVFIPSAVDATSSEIANDIDILGEATRGVDDDNLTEIVNKYKDINIADYTAPKDIKKIIDNEMMFWLWIKINNVIEEEYDRENYKRLIKYICDYLNGEGYNAKHRIIGPIVENIKGYIKSYPTNGPDEARIKDMLHLMRLRNAAIKYFEDCSACKGNIEEIESDCGLEPGELEAFLG